MVIPVGKFFQELRLVTKKEGKVLIKNIIPVSFVPMIKKNKPCKIKNIDYNKEKSRREIYG
jgi:protein-L-isoaspartate O-methyltransferase